MRDWAKIEAGCGIRKIFKAGCGMKLFCRERGYAFFSRSGCGMFGNQFRDGDGENHQMTEKRQINTPYSMVLQIIRADILRVGARKNASNE